MGLVLGKQFSATDNTNFPQVLEGLNDHSCSLEVNGDWCAEGTGDRVLGHPLHALCWLANQMGKRGETLKKGELITTGVVVDKLVVVNVGDTVNVNYGDLLGTVTFSFEK